MVTIFCVHFTCTVQNAIAKLLWIQVLHDDE